MPRHNIAEGFSVERTEDGGVRLALAENGRDDAAEVKAIELTPMEWCSAIAAVCDGGETATRYRAALELHTSPRISD